MSGSLDQALIRQLFDELSAALEARGVRGHVYLIGGGAMITGYGRNRTTKDIDVRIDEAKDEVLAAAAAIGARHGLDERWLDLGAAQFVPRGDDVRAKTIHNSPGLLVTGASAEHLLAMKVFAGRRPDLEDIKHLTGILGITRTSDAIRICERAYPGWLVMERTRRNVGDAIAEGREERGEPVPELTLERNTTLCAEGAGSRRYEVMTEEAGRRQRDAACDGARPRGAGSRRAAARPKGVRRAGPDPHARWRQRRGQQLRAPGAHPGRDGANGNARRTQAGGGAESRGGARSPLPRRVDPERRGRRPARRKRDRPVKRRRGAGRPRAGAAADGWRRRRALHRAGERGHQPLRARSRGSEPAGYGGPQARANGRRPHGTGAAAAEQATVRT